MNFDNLFNDPFAFAFFSSFVALMLYSIVSAQMLLSFQKRYKVGLKRNKFGWLLVSRLKKIMDDSTDADLKRSLKRCILLLVINRILFVLWGGVFLTLILLTKN